MQIDKDATKQKDIFKSETVISPFTLHKAGKCGVMLM